MKSKLLISLLLIIGCVMPAPAQHDTFRKWMTHVDEVYHINMIENMTPEAVKNIQKDPAPLARMLGYALSLQLKFVRRESSKHRIWLRLEEQSENFLKDLVKTAAAEQMLSARDKQDLEKRVLQEFAAATVGWHDSQMAALTFVHQENAPDFFDILEGGTGTTTGNQEEDPGEAEEAEDPEPEPENPGAVSDEILGLWTWTHAYTKPHSDQVIKQKLSVHIRRAGVEQQETMYGPQPVYVYEGYVAAIENVTDERSRPAAAEGDLIWKIRYTSTNREPSPQRLSYSFDNLIDRYGEFTVYLIRPDHVLEIGKAKYYRGSNGINRP